MEFILLIVQVVIAVFLIGFVLLQRSDNDGFGMGSGSGGGLMSSRGQANFMTKTTSLLAVAFMANSLLLTILTTQGTSSSLIDEVVAEQPFQVPTDGKETGAAIQEKIEDAGAAVEKAVEGAEDKATGALDDVVKTLKEQTGEAAEGVAPVEAPKAE